MSRINKSKFQLNIDLKNQIKLLTKRCNDFDNGDQDEALSIAVRLRVLLHDARRQKSLLTQVGMKDALPYHSSVSQFSGHSLIFYSGLSAISMTAGEDSDYSPMLNMNKARLLNFDDWWNELIIDDKENLFSRRDLVLNVADTAGGAHVDEGLEEAYHKLTVENSLGMKSYDGHRYKDFETNIAYLSVRVIAEELIYTYNKFFYELYGASIYRKVSESEYVIRFYEIDNIRIYTYMKPDNPDSTEYTLQIDENDSRFKDGFYTDRHLYEMSFNNKSGSWKYYCYYK